MESVCISSSANITDSAIESLSVCSNLKTLDLSQCPRISSSGITKLLTLSDRNIQHLNLASNSYVDGQVIRAIASMRSLVKLNLSSCSNMSGFDVILLADKKGKKFQSLNLDNNPKLSSQTLQMIRKSVGDNVLSDLLTS